jgi:hypothetical protein
MTVRLRPHHLLCLLTYVGRGYSPGFIANFDAVAMRVASGEDVLIVSGPDDVCTPLLAESDAHCRRDSVGERDRLAAQKVGEVLGIPVRRGSALSLDESALARLRKHFRTGEIRPGCQGCSWMSLCTAIAKDDFRGTRIGMAAHPAG